MSTPPPTPPSKPTAEERHAATGVVRLPSPRASLALAAVTLAIGLAAGAAIGPAPNASFANGSSFAQRLPLLLAAIKAHSAATRSTPATTAAVEPPAIERESTPAASSSSSKASSSSGASKSASPEAGSQESSSTPKSSPKAKQKKLPAITNVWLIELDGSSFEAADAAPTAAPYIVEALLPHATLLNDWSALQASAFASEAALAEPPAAGASPPLLHSIVQPPCPEGAAGAGCAPETPGQLTTADTFLKTVLAPITATATYREHGLVVVT